MVLAGWGLTRLVSVKFHRPVSRPRRNKYSTIHPLSHRSVNIYLSAFSRPDRLLLADNTHNSRLNLRRGHLLQHAHPRLTQREQARKLHRALLQLQLRAGGVLRQDLGDAVLFCDGGGGARSGFGDRGQHELPDEVVGVGRVKNGGEEVDEVFVGYLS